MREKAEAVGTLQFTNNMKIKNGHFVIDTSALLFDPASLTFFPKSHVYIPVSVLQELDGHKDRLDEVGSNARTVNRTLYDLKKVGDLNKGVKCPDKDVIVHVVPEELDDIPVSLSKESPDNRILSVCITLLKDEKLKDKVYLITNDLNLGLKAEAYGIKNFAFQPEAKYVKTEYKGYREIEDAEDLVIDDLYQKKSLSCPKRLSALENEYFIIKNKMSKQSAMCVHREGKLLLIDNDISCMGIKPLNSEQMFALDLLLDPDIKLVTLTGLAGSGKTLLSIAAGLHQCTGMKGEYERMMISRSLVLLSGKDKLGYLKGGIKEKLEPYLLPLKDAIDQVMGEDNLAFEYLTGSISDNPDKNVNKKQPKIEIEPLQYIRGRSLRNVFFIIDEAQNLTLSEVKTIISRAGEGAKIVLLGDTHQIDNPYLTKHTNGIAQVIERFKESKIAGHISLREGVRSELATEAAERL